jgi:hypothetical protein
MLLLLRSLLEAVAVEPPAQDSPQLMGPDDDYDSHIKRLESEREHSNQIVMAVLMSIVASGVLEE